MGVITERSIKGRDRCWRGAVPDRTPEFTIGDRSRSRVFGRPRRSPLTSWRKHGDQTRALGRRSAAWGPDKLLVTSAGPGRGTGRADGPGSAGWRSTSSTITTPAPSRASSPISAAPTMSAPTFSRSLQPDMSWNAPACRAWCAWVLGRTTPNGIPFASPAYRPPSKDATSLTFGRAQSRDGALQTT